MTTFLKMINPFNSITPTKMINPLPLSNNQSWSQKIALSSKIQMKKMKLLGFYKTTHENYPISLREMFHETLEDELELIFKQEETLRRMSVDDDGSAAEQVGHCGGSVLRRDQN
jgi:hypothetical protein